MTIWHDIVFMEGDNADEALDILDEHGLDALWDYVMQWETDGEGHQTRDHDPAGADDERDERVDGAYTYTLAWHHGLRYVGLTRHA